MVMFVPLDITEVTQTQPDTLEPGGKRRRRCRAQESDSRHLPRLLRKGRKRPRRGTTEKRDEFASPLLADFLACGLLSLKLLLQSVHIINARTDARERRCITRTR
jgi:hypothetical protein